MRIAIVAPTAIPARRANTIQVMKMAQAAAALGHEVRLTSPDYGVEESALPAARSWPALSRHYGLQHTFAVEWLPARAGWRGYDYGWQVLGWARSWGAEVLYTRLPQAAALASLSGFPTILEVHDMPQGFSGPWLFHLFSTGRGARRMVIISQALLKDLQQNFHLSNLSGAVLVEPDGVDLERYQDLPDPQQARAALIKQGVALDAARFTAGYSGHLYAGRGVELMIELASRSADIQFLLVGGNPEDVARMRKLAEERQCTNVLLTGFVPNADLPLYQAACDVLLMPYQPQISASSGGDIARYLSPMKLFEYLACGRAILSSDLPVLGEVLNSSNSRLLPAQNVTAWQQALDELRCDDLWRTALGAQARQDAQHYSWQARVERIFRGNLL